MKKEMIFIKKLLPALMALAVVFCTAVPAFASSDKTAEERLSEIREKIVNRKVGKYGMVPIYPRDIKDGTYDITVDSNSAFFKVRKAQITVEDGRMTGSITIASTSYKYVFQGTKKEAEKADSSSWISPKIENGFTTFTFPIEALDSEIDCAAYSKARKRWYDRKILFVASSLPEDALKIDIPDYELIEDVLWNLMPEDMPLPDDGPGTEGAVAVPISVELADGEYSIELDMTGGSGRASLSSPTLLTVKDGKAYARLLWSSAYYDYVVLDGQVFYNQTTDGGNSTFDIPITALDEPVTLIGDTTAMGDPLEIEYTLTFYADSVGDKGRIPQEAAKLVIVIAAAIIVIGGILNWFIKKRRAK